MTSKTTVHSVEELRTWITRCAVNHIRPARAKAKAPKKMSVLDVIEAAEAAQQQRVYTQLAKEITADLREQNMRGLAGAVNQLKQRGFGHLGQQLGGAR